MQAFALFDFGHVVVADWHMKSAYMIHTRLCANELSGAHMLRRRCRASSNELIVLSVSLRSC